MSGKILSLFGSLVIIFCLVFFLQPAHAATVTVTTCDAASLNAAYAAANDGDTIDFDCDGAITLSSALFVTKSVTFDATGQNVSIGSASMAVFYLNAPGKTIEFRGLTIGSGNIANVPGIYGYRGTLTINNCIFDGNSGYQGGAIVAQENTTINNSIFRNGFTTSGGGGSAFIVYPTANVTVNSSTFSNNTTTGLGGAIRNDGTLVINDSTFTNNSAATGSGGAIGMYRNSTLTLNNTNFTGNSARQGGAIQAFISPSSVTINGGSFTGNTATFYNGGGVLYVASGVILNVNGANFSNNISNPAGGALTVASGGIANFANTTFLNNGCVGTIVDQGGNTVTNSAGCLPVPTSNFTFSANGLTVNFTDTSTTNPNAWSWTFGNGNTSTAQHPSYSYAAGGTYTVCLRASNVNGAGSNRCQTVIVTAPPVANFTYSASDLTVNFTDTSSNTPTAWAWNFGDGNSDTVQNPSHTFAAGGTFNVCLTASNSGGSSASPSCQSITVTPPTVTPVASYTYTVSSLTANLTDTSSNTPTAWAWDFGDGSTSTTQSPSYTYATANTYNVCLIATNSAGSSASSCQSITVTTPVFAPTASFTYSASGLSVTFTDTSIDSPTSWLWDFGDLGSDTMQNPSYTYATAGTYNVCLTSTNGVGSSAPSCQMITVSVPVTPIAPVAPAVVSSVVTAPAIVPTLPPPPSCVEMNNNNFTVAAGLYCNVLMQNGGWIENLGVPHDVGSIPDSVIQFGVIFAVDVIYYDMPGHAVNSFPDGNYQRVCLQGTGRFLYDDGRNLDNIWAELTTEQGGGYTCAWIAAPGIVVLVER